MNVTRKRCGWIVLAMTMPLGQSMGQTDPCPEFGRYLAARGQLEHHEPALRAAEMRRWLERLIPVVDAEGCGAGVASARWHTMALANALEDWTVSLDLARGGLGQSSDPADRALWQMNIAGATYHKRSATSPQSVTSAIAEIDAFLILAPDLGREGQAGDAPPWLLPVVNALTWRAKCQRELGDFLGAAFTEQRVATSYVAAGVQPEARYGGFLPEEALARSSADLVRAGRHMDAAGAISTIRNLPSTVRPAGQHAVICLSAVTDPDQALEFAQALLTIMPRDEWMVMVCLDAAETIHNASRNPDRDRAALNLTDEALFAPGATELADARRAAARQSAGLPDDPQGVGHRARLLQQRARIAMDLKDHDTASAAIAHLVAGGHLLDWCRWATDRLTQIR